MINTYISGVARGVGGGREATARFDQATHWFGLAALARWAAVLCVAALTLGSFGLSARALTAHPSTADQIGWLD